MQYASEFTIAMILVCVGIALLECLERGHECSPRKILVEIVRFWFMTFAHLFVSSLFTR